ncbi:GerAB/ArcD/ProY family transporter [Paenibacillus sp. 1001270B_150601_E10]|uniref:GerAB/ArcD/ProY family transporter n=1 Tax=Paenibacillus sp. 1001270B_150601_E10 TaxID=2787079 RepID=UPI00189F1E65|nr:endospore germination permease [Paenibacillus sp. 1001270B_150601_E10]
MRTETIESKPFMLLATMYMISYGVVLIPGFLAHTARQQAWQAVIIGTLVCILASYLLMHLFRKHPGLSLFELMDLILGRWLSTVLILVLVWIVAFIAFASLLNFTQGFITTQIMPETPEWTFGLMFIIVVVVGVKLGLKTLARAGEILFYIFNILFFTLILSVIPQMKEDPSAIKLAPFFEVGWKPMLYSVWNYCGITGFSLIALLAFFPKYMSKPKQASKTLVFSAILGSSYLFIIVFFCTLVMGYELTATTLYPSYALAQRINLGNFFTRVEVLMAASWFITIYIKLIFYFKFSLSGLAHVFRIKNEQLLTIPFSLILLILSFYIFPNTSDWIEWENTLWPMISLVFLIGIPILVLLIGRMRRLI